MGKFSNLFKVGVVLAATAVPSVVLASGVEINFSETTGYGVSAGSVQIDNIRVDNVITNPFDPTRPTIVSSYYNVPFTFDAASLHLVPGLGSARPNDTTTQCSAATIIVTNAFNGNPLVGAAVSIGSSTVYTDSTGTATFSGLVEGSAMISASSANYTDASRSATLSCTTPTSLGLSLSPTTGEGALAATDVRVTLTWGEQPRDLDSYLTGPNAGAADDTNRFRVYYGSRTGEVAALDVDDTSGFGPETITISPPTGATTLRDGIYRYSVRHYSGTSDISTSGASVSLNIGGRVREFLPPSDTTGLALGASDVWTVFELVVANGSVTVLPVNTYTTGVGSSSVRSTTTGYGSVETGIDYSRLPAK